MPYSNKTNIITVTLATKITLLAITELISEEIYTILKIFQTSIVMDGCDRWSLLRGHYRTGELHWKVPRLYSVDAFSNPQTYTEHFEQQQTILPINATWMNVSIYFQLQVHKQPLLLENVLCYESVLVFAWTDVWIGFHFCLELWNSFHKYTLRLSAGGKLTHTFRAFMWNLKVGSVFLQNIQ